MDNRATQTERSLDRRRADRRRADRRLATPPTPAQRDVPQFIDGGANGSIVQNATAEDIGNAGVVRLTKREQEIKELIAAGLGNKEIARRLHIATNTVKSHVHNMLGKLAAITPPDRRRQGRRSRRGASRRSYRLIR